LNHHRTDDRHLIAAGWITAALVVSAWAAVLARGVDAPFELTAVLVASALTCAAALAVRRAPTAAWLAFIGASAITATQAGSLSIEARSRSADPDAWLPAAVLVSATVTAAAIVAWLYASRASVPRAGRYLAAALIGWLIGAFVVTVTLALAGVPGNPALTIWDILLAPTRAPRILIGTIAAVGLLADLDPAIRRARSRVKHGQGGWRSTILILVDEVSGRAATRRTAALTERRRLAGELHADIVPAIRTAVRDAEDGAPAERLAASLRTVADELDRLVDDRSSVILESLGLVAALEGLAERIEAREGVAIVLEVAEPEVAAVGDRVGDARPPLEVETTAYLVARLAIDNAIRHGDARRIDVVVAESDLSLLLVIEDDGRPIAADGRATAIARGRRGLADMERAAAEIAASLTVAPADPGGTTVKLAWPARGGGGSAARHSK
jgi:signal transduction histidine kinase